MNPSHQEVIHAYRHLYQHLLRAVRYSKPARYVARDRLRNAFRNSSLEAYNGPRIARTLEFLDGAAKTAGLEHKILKNVLHVWHGKSRLDRQYGVQPAELALRRKAYQRFEETVQKLNESMGLCIM